MKGVSTWEDLCKAAVQGHKDSFGVQCAIEILERGNQPRVVEAIRRSRAGLAAATIRDALVVRISMLTTRAYAPVTRNDDHHLRAAVEFLSVRGGIKQATERSRAQLLALVGKFTAIESDPRTERLIRMRNKRIAHLGLYGDENKEPLFVDLLWCARETSHLWNLLSIGAQTTTFIDDKSITRMKESANVFWSKWE